MRSFRCCCCRQSRKHLAPKRRLGSLLLPANEMPKGFPPLGKPSKVRGTLSRRLGRCQGVNPASTCLPERRSKLSFQVWTVRLVPKHRCEHHCPTRQLDHCQPLVVEPPGKQRAEYGLERGRHRDAWRGQMAQRRDHADERQECAHNDHSQPEPRVELAPWERPPRL